MAEKSFVKYCPVCGAANPAQQAFCLECLDGDLSTVQPEMQRKRASSRQAPSEPARPEPATRQVIVTPRCVLEAIDDPGLRFSVKEGQTVGRTAKADVVLERVPKLEWISSVHAKFTRRGEQWYVQHVGSTNYIKVDGETYRGQEEVALHEGSVLIISLTPFRVTFGGG